jgi:hypothetical protein
MRRVSALAADLTTHFGRCYKSPYEGCAQRSWLSLPARPVSAPLQTQRRTHRNLHRRRSAERALCGKGAALPAARRKCPFGPWGGRCSPRMGRKVLMSPTMGLRVVPSARSASMGPREAPSPAARMTWLEICRSERFRGRWVALDNVRYEAGSTVPVEAEVADSDEDLAALCSRMRAADRTACAILFCDEPPPPVTVRRPSPSPRVSRRTMPN